MAEQTAAVQNKGMLIVALVLGVAAVILHNMQMAALRADLAGEQVKALQFQRDMRQGEKIDVAKDLSEVLVSKSIADHLGDVAIMKNPEMKNIFNGNTLNRGVQKGNFFSASMTTVNVNPSPSTLIQEPRNVAKAVALREAPGNILRAGDQVNLVGRVQTKEGFHSARIIEDVRVLAIGGQVQHDPSAGMGGMDEGMTNYRSITIEVSKQASLELDEVIAKVGGAVGLEVLSPRADRSPDAGKVKANLFQQSETGAPPSGGGRSPL